ncbi:berberine bridge enzyme-like 23 [Cornus florida]|uniref:berberine bridge enzyme-like 23 n=1 Tax=Cornus florida TaxID=4283 RepID=UPI0028A2DCFA|nr:berberine bridge enzyme-like 23 [Cornus florida]
MGCLAVLLSLVLFSLSWTTCYAALENFLQCMSTGDDESLNYIYPPTSPSYSSLMKSSQQNPRWLNSTVRKPLFFITPNSEAEIQASILCSTKHGLQVRVLSGGHDYEGLSYRSRTPFIVINLINLRSISIDMEDETAWVQSGAVIGELFYSIAQKSSVHGFPAGLCPSVGVGGHFSGGGFGTLVRKYGLAADHVIDANLIDANGRILNRETMGEDLFWAIRGGGGASFGVIVSWRIKLVQVPPTVTAFTLDKKLDQGAIKIVHRWQYVADKFPEDLFVRILIQSDGENKVKAQFQSLFLGRIEELIPLMNKSFPELGLRAQDCAEMTWIQSVLVSAGYPKSNSLDVLLSRTDQYQSFFKAKSDFVKEPIPESGLEGIWERFLEEELPFMIMDPFGGRMNDISESELPFPHRKGNLYNIQHMVKWVVDDDTATKKHVDWIRNIYEYMKPFVSNSPRAAYINYKDLDLGINQEGNASYAEAKVWGIKYFKGNFERLIRVKTNTDPTNFFRNEQSIPILP